MRIIAGKYARRRLFSPKGHLTRPTMSQTRESLFHLVEARMELRGAHVLDLFAGTGAIGLEALSRGAESVTFVENVGRVLKFARRNAEELDVADQCVFIRTDAVSYLERYRGPSFDLIVADPPYDLEAMPRMPKLALPLVADGGLFVLEHDRRIFFDEHPDLDTCRPYGRTFVSVFRPSLASEEASAEAADGGCIDGEQVDGEQVDGERVDGERADDRRADRTGSEAEDSPADDENDPT